jgi:hypothetical protein
VSVYPQLGIHLPVVVDVDHEADPGLLEQQPDAAVAVLDPVRRRHARVIEQPPDLGLGLDLLGQSCHAQRIEPTPVTEQDAFAPTV